MQRKRKLNVLINNAAMMLSSRDLTPRHTADGLEITMATNHFGGFSLLFLCLCVMHICRHTAHTGLVDR